MQFNLARLRCVSAAYLGLPVLIFFVTWYRLPFALLVTLGTLIVIRHRFVSRRKVADSSPPLPQSTSLVFITQLLIAFIPILAVLAISGIAGFGYQDGDWGKHNSIFNALVERAWPVHFDVSIGTGILGYYVAYYLPAALIGKLFNLTIGYIALFIWSVLGCWLVYLWLIRLTGLKPWFATTLFLLFSGIDILGCIPVMWRVEGWDWMVDVLSRAIINGRHTERWIDSIQYTSNIAQLYWVPQHALAGWLFCFLALSAYRSQRLEQVAILLVGGAALWSVFVALGLSLLFLILFIVTIGTSYQIKWPLLFSVENGFGLLIGMLLLGYFGSLVVETSLIEGIIKPSPYTGFAFFDFSAEHAVFQLSFFIVAELLWLLPLWLISMHLTHQQNLKTYRPLLIGTTISLLIFPFVSYGGYNDLTMRASLPALAILMVLIGQALAEKSIAIKFKIGLIALLFVGAFLPYVEVMRHIKRIDRMPYWKTSIMSQQSLFDIQHVRVLVIDDKNGEKIVIPDELGNRIGQYIISDTSFFATYLMANRRDTIPLQADAPQASIPIPPLDRELDRAIAPGQLNLIEAQVSAAQITAGETLNITTTWDYSGVVMRDGGVCIYLIHESGEQVDENCQKIVKRSIFHWEAGKQYHKTYQFEIDEEMPSGRYTLKAALLEVATGGPEIGSILLDKSFDIIVEQ